MNEDPYENISGRHRFANQLQDEGAVGAAMRPWKENVLLGLGIVLALAGIVRGIYWVWSP